MHASVPACARRAARPIALGWVGARSWLPTSGWFRFCCCPVAPDPRSCASWRIYPQTVRGSLVLFSSSTAVAGRPAIGCGLSRRPMNANPKGLLRGKKNVALETRERCFSSIFGPASLAQPCGVLSGTPVQYRVTPRRRLFTENLLENTLDSNTTTN